MLPRFSPVLSSKWQFDLFARYVKRWWLRDMFNRAANDLRAGLLDAVLDRPMPIVQSGRPEVLAGQEGWYRVFKQLEDLGWSMQA